MEETRRRRGGDVEETWRRRGGEEIEGAGIRKDLLT